MDIMEIIRTSAVNRHKLRIVYTKKKTGETVEHIVEPYSMRGNLFYAWRPDVDKIRAFIFENIQEVEETQEPYEPRYEVEF